VHFDSNIVSTLEFNHGHLRGVSFRGCNDIQRALREIHFPLQELEVVHCFTEERWAIDHAVQTDKFMLGYEAVPVFSTSRAALRLGGVQNFVLDNYMSAYVNSVRVQTDVPSMSSKYLAEFAPASQYIVRQLNAFTCEPSSTFTIRDLTFLYPQISPTFLFSRTSLGCKWLCPSPRRKVGKALQVFAPLSLCNI
jgi:hypothetical protein